jgi:IS5 family transposase
MSHQIQLVCLEDLVPEDHLYRRFISLLDFNCVDDCLRDVTKDNAYKGYGIVRLFKCLLLQFIEDLSDRELERFLQENNAGKWFCGFDLTVFTPDHTIFSRARKRIGVKRLSELFSKMRDQLKSRGYMNEVFSFIDATHLIAKANLWKERDEAIKRKYEKLNNQILPKVANDPQARIGCKGKDKFWYGFKQHTSVDMQSGLINKIAVTPANVTDAKGFKHVCPTQGAAYADKAYGVKSAQVIAQKKNVHLAAILKNNMKAKNKDKDRWYTKIRAPYERVFSGQNKRVRYQGVAKNQFSAFMFAIVFNLKRLMTITPPNFTLA